MPAALRHFFYLRGNIHAEDEIRTVAIAVWELVRKEAPNFFADIELKQENGKDVLVTPFSEGVSRSTLAHQRRQSRSPSLRRSVPRCERHAWACFSRWHIPAMFIVQPASLQTSDDACVLAMHCTLSSTIAPLIAGIFDGERSAETAALIGLFHRLEIDIADLAQQPHALIPHANAAKVAGVVVGDVTLLRQRDTSRRSTCKHLVEEFDELDMCARTVACMRFDQSASSCSSW